MAAWVEHVCFEYTISKGMSLGINWRGSRTVVGRADLAGADPVLVGPGDGINRSRFCWFLFFSVSLLGLKLSIFQIDKGDLP